MNRAISVRQKKAKGGFFAGSSRGNLSVCICDPLGLAAGWNFEGRAFEREDLLASKFLMMAGSSERHGLFEQQPPSRF